VREGEKQDEERERKNGRLMGVFYLLDMAEARSK
jgi:hypothetical protein